MTLRKSRYDSVELRPAEPAESFDAYQGVWVIVEQREGQIQDVTRELLGAARPMAKKLGCKVVAVLLCHETGGMANELIEAGADDVIVCEHPILKTPLARPSADVLTRIIKERKPEIVLIGATHTGRDVSSRVAVKIDAGMTADCTELDVDELSGELLARRPAFGGKMLATIRCDRHRPQMATARPGIFVPLDPHPGRSGGTEQVDVSWLDDETYHAAVLDYVIDESKVDITKSDVLVAGGMGIGGPEGFEKLQELADVLGGKVAASRPVCDKGWVPRAQQVGQTGLSVRPKLYIAVGISGAIQHIEGMKESGTVIAVNNDPNASIFHYADLGIVGDWKAAVDGFIEAAQEKGLKDMRWMVPTKDTLGADREAAAERAAKAKAKEGKASGAAAKNGAEPTTKKATAVPGGDGTGAEATPDAADSGDAPAGEDAPDARASTGDADDGPASAGDVPAFDGDPDDRDAVAAWVKENVPEESRAWVVAADCIVCNGCEAACPTGAAVIEDLAVVDRDICIADGACFDACPTDAIRPGIEDPDTSAGWPEGSRLHGEIGANAN